MSKESKNEGKQRDLKKKGYYVPSRHLQVAEKISMQSILSKDRSTESCRYGQGLGKTSEDTSKLNATQSAYGMTSTPSTEKEKFAFPILDASAVTSADGYLGVPHLKERIVSSVSVDCVKRNLKKSFKPRNVPISVSCREKKKNDYDQKAADAEIDLLYAVYLQTTFLESESKKALETRSSIAIEKLHKLLDLVLGHIQKSKSQKYTLKITSMLIEVYEHCQKQENILKPVFEIIPTVEEQYKNLAESINAMKHNLQVKDVIIPEPGPIIELLQELTEFTHNFFDEALPNYKDIISSADSLKQFVDSGELIIEALQRGSSLLTNARDLSISEASLALGREEL